ncbi:MBL fold metallo-hydrolase [Candidatus Chloroploca sp. Khr17]|uniref:MBL fold metallo-hydrolase n=1 Tax=Candidatus Chloroploca sp. Khr17 TaxID=2496869 RepID=UPI00101B9AB5|nr:MBL fold metallo-hydrolase [Candidatus Chloroploca sp. Khr17]
MSTYPIVHTFDGKFVELPRDHVHAYIVELENSVVLVDATLALSSASEFRAKAEALGKPLKAVLMTHGHPDHYVGLAKFADLPRYGSQGCLDFAIREDVAKAAIAKYLFGDDFPDERVFPDQIISDGFTITFDGVTFTFTDLGPAESDSDGMWSFEKDGVLHAFVGDTVANHTHCFFRDGHTPNWLRALDRLEKELPDNALLYIGHGATPSSKEIIEWQRGYIHTFLDAVKQLTSLEALAATRPTQEKMIAAVKEYLPNDVTLFLLDYELHHSIPETWKQLQV